ncbi:MAG: quaternary ammonium compound efflux SMR transporter SugE [Desulfitobacteriaceae bacterium]|nr:quaternary ammonium compound efflux SMR transporter SugE [Desulfitobacteriaceae bacterium]
MAWILLFVASLLEIFWAVCMKYTEGFTQLFPSILTGVGIAASLFFLSLALKTLPIGTAYAVWTGIGAVGTVIAGMILFGESRDWLRILCILLIVAGIVGLRFVSTEG